VRSWIALACATIALGVGAPAHADDKVPVWLGIQYSQGGAMGIPVTHVFDGTAAAEAGIKIGDEIIEFGGVRTQPSAQLAPLITALDVGEHVKCGPAR
jgi:predicted metalloprotease with PDZ domain